MDGDRGIQHKNKSLFFFPIIINKMELENKTAVVLVQFIEYFQWHSNTFLNKV